MLGDRFHVTTLWEVVVLSLLVDKTLATRPMQRLFDPTPFTVELRVDAAAATFGCHPSGRYNIRVNEAFYAEAFTATEDKCLAPEKPCLGVSLTKDIQRNCECAKSCTLDLSAFEPKQRQCAGLEDSTKMRLIVFYTCESITPDCKNHQDFLDKPASDTGKQAAVVAC
ncbi:hypothetical protein BV898_17573 [Hypsibius exemplaris]|uniref:SUEL-type lectin domain-containing protein n=1 Tax=Hypsibius exemplaris TaxID=2072580 RepID=A0A9X6NI76_HYPEX|nr:hypothetical protein BV898_17573 [Hypsibius exemplaris]